MTHITGQYGTDAGAMRKEEVDDDDLPFQFIEGYGLSQLILQRDIRHFVPDGICHLFPVFHPGNHRIREIATGHSHAILPGDHIKEERYHYRYAYGQNCFLTHAMLFKLKKPSPAAMVPVLFFNVLYIPKRHTLFW
jgi:hypothetical protein